MVGEPQIGQSSQHHARVEAAISGRRFPCSTSAVSVYNLLTDGFKRDGRSVSVVLGSASSDGPHRMRNDGTVE
jgi:hypothetical protein